MPRIVDLGITKYLWVPAGGVAVVTAPTAAELTAGSVKDISQFVVTTTNVQASASDTTNEKAITDTANVVVPTIGNYEGNLVLFRDFTSGAPTSSVDLLATFNAAGIVGYVVRRVGKASSAAVVATDVVDVFKFMTDNPQIQGGTGEGYLKLTVPLLQQGSFKVGAVVAA
ncbi:hypothetical protein ACPPVT_07490 [Angustibacter sp. McL0619]|uniref:phage tail tube protein n=1 Tax=Angustibacter sp. McL0619 TaxID=3415676 RepID=UPI003CF59CF6